VVSDFARPLLHTFRCTFQVRGPFCAPQANVRPSALCGDMGRGLERVAPGLIASTAFRAASISAAISIFSSPRGLPRSYQISSRLIFAISSNWLRHAYVFYVNPYAMLHCLDHRVFERVWGQTAILTKIKKIKKMVARCTMMPSTKSCFFCPPHPNSINPMLTTDPGRTRSTNCAYCG
jgi:hypothetical protein